MVVWFLMSLESPDNWRCHPILFAQISLPWLLWCHNPAHSPAAEVGSRESFVGKVSIFNVINREAPKTFKSVPVAFLLCFVRLFHFRSKLKRMHTSIFAFTLMLLPSANKSRNLCLLLISYLLISKIEIQIKINRIYFWNRTSHEFTNDNSYWKTEVFLISSSSLLMGFSNFLSSIENIFSFSLMSSLSPSGVKTL